MNALISCPQCSRQLSVPKASLGQRVKCPPCGFVFVAQENNSQPAAGSPQGSTRQQPQPVLAACPQCRQQVRVLDTTIGHTVRCPHCSSTFTAQPAAPPAPNVAPAPAPVLTTCSHCKRQVRVPANVLGRPVKCPLCGSTFTAQAAAPPSQPPREAARPKAAPAPRPVLQDTGLTMQPDSAATPFDFPADDLDLQPVRPRRVAARPRERAGPAGFLQQLQPLLRVPGVVHALACLGIPVLALVVQLFGAGGLGFWLALILAVVLAAGCFALMQWQGWPAVRRTLASSGLIAAGYLVVLVAALVFKPGTSDTTGDGSNGGHEATATGLPTDLSLVPHDAAGFLSVRVADTWDQEQAAPLRKLAKDNPMASLFLDQLKAKAGLTIADVERAVAIMPTADSHPEPLLLVTTKTSKTIDRAGLVGVFLPGAKEKKVGEKSFFTAGTAPFGIHFADDHTLLAGAPAAVEAFLKQPASKEEGPLTGALREAGGKHTLVLGFNPSRFADQAKKQIPPGMEKFQPLLDARAGMLTVDVTSELQVTVQLTFAKEEQARAGEEAAKALLVMAPLVMPQVVKQLEQAPRPGDPSQKMLVGLLNNMGDALQHARAERDGMVVHITLHVRMPDLSAAP
ncbi:MAG TPA: hypothetical protein VG013_18415 [Gemmataceae bacterium]|jgi:DNA-directed RNA polymerase subunit RPC12/RpoP|nr:hypothetical protein [Gemmataceae bacterium]